MSREWRVEFDAMAAKELKKLGGAEQRRIVKYLRERIAGRSDPRRLGTALTGDFAGLWRYRVGDTGSSLPLKTGVSPSSSCAPGTAGKSTDEPTSTRLLRVITA